jgi:hypothetical protein
MGDEFAPPLASTVKTDETGSTSATETLEASLRGLFCIDQMLRQLAGPFRSALESNQRAGNSGV